MIENAIGTVTEGGFGRPATRLTAPVGYNVRLFKGGIWMLQMQGVVTAGVGNAALTVVSKGTAAVSFQVVQQGGVSQPISHNYTAGALSLLLGTDAGGNPNTTPQAAAAYLEGLGGALDTDFLAFIPGGTGLGIMATFAPTPFNPKHCWIPGKDVQPGLVKGGRGTEDIDNALGAAKAQHATAEQGIHKLRNDDDGTPVTSILTDVYLMDDDQCSASDGGGTRSKIGQAVFIDFDGSVFVDEYR